MGDRRAWGGWLGDGLSRSVVFFPEFCLPADWNPDGPAVGEEEKGDDN